MALNVQFIKYLNQLINEEIVVPRLVSQQTLDFNALCEYLADGSTVTAADVAAVMKQIEMRLPLVLGLNAKVICSPEGLTFRPKVTGSITQSQLKAKLEAKLAEDPTADIDVNRPLKLSDLSVSDLTASIAIEMPKMWQDRFQSKATFKRVKTSTDGSENSEESENSGDSGSGGGETSGGSSSGSETGGETGGSTGGGETPSGGETPGGGESGGGSTGGDGGDGGDDGFDKD